MHIFCLLALLAITACTTPLVFVETDNAPVARGNLNSVGAAIGTLYLYDAAERTMSRIADTEVTPKLTNSGSYSQNASSEIMLDFRNVPAGVLAGIEPSIRSQVGSSLEFRMSHYEQRAIPNPEGSLNAPASQAFFEGQRARANNDNFRYVFVVDGYFGEDISMLWDGQPADGTTTTFRTGVPTAPQVEIRVKRGASINCQGMANTCVFTAQVFRLVENAGALRLELDTRLTTPDWIQRMFNREPLTDATA